jgi:hypothetical protein
VYDENSNDMDEVDHICCQNHIILYRIINVVICISRKKIPLLFRQNENEDKGFQAAYVELSGAGHMRFVYARDVFLQLRKAVALFNGTHVGEEQ